MPARVRGDVGRVADTSATAPPATRATAARPVRVGGGEGVPARVRGDVGRVADTSATAPPATRATAARPVRVGGGGRGAGTGTG